MGLSFDDFNPVSNIETLFSDPFSEAGVISSIKLGGPDPGVVAGTKLHEGIFHPGVNDAPFADPKDLVTPFRRPLQERLVTNLFLGAGGPTQALSELARSRLLAQRGGIPAASTGISATARARLVGSTGKSSAQINAEAAIAERAARRHSSTLEATRLPDIFEGGGQG